MHNTLNVFKFGYHSSSWRHPIESIKYFFRNLKYAWQRATRGFSDWDLWNLDSYYSNLIWKSLESFVNMHKYGTPSEDITIDEWNEKVHSVAELFRNSIEDESDYRNKFEEEYNRDFYQYLDEHENDIDAFMHYSPKNSEEYWEEEKKISQMRTNSLYEGLNKLKEIWFDLWD